jgi:hypothetical protein
MALKIGEKIFRTAPTAEVGLVKRLLRKLDGDGRDPLVELQAAAEAMLADGWGRDRASIGLLSSQVNTWRKKAPKPVGDKYAHGF